MGDKLLVRVYRVGVGDCIYVRIPEGDDGFHILIDCGTVGSVDLLKSTINNLKEEMLPDAGEPGKKRLDLLVATHRHRDHIKGFDPEFFRDIQIKNIWLSAAMNPKHPQSKNAHKLHEIATKGMRDIEALGLALNSPLQMLVSLYSLNNDAAMNALRKLLPEANGISPKYVHAKMSKDELNLPSSSPTIRVLAPEEDIDGYYLGKEADETLRGFQESNVYFAKGSSLAAEKLPENISESDFRLLQSRLLSNAFAFAEKDSSLQNNTSIVLLIKWRNRRLLFGGDAEWEGEYKEGKHNGSWNVMWKRHSRHLKESVDFLKIGHHGSVNATPWSKKKGPDYEVNKILNAILPLPESGKRPTAKAVVSTERINLFETIPSPYVLEELGKRVKNTCTYFSKLEDRKRELGKEKILDLFEEQLFSEKWTPEDYWRNENKDLLKKPQPWRTDLEMILTGRDYVDVEIDPGD